MSTAMVLFDFGVAPYFFVPVLRTPYSVDGNKKARPEGSNDYVIQTRGFCHFSPCDSEGEISIDLVQ